MEFSNFYITLFEGLIEGNELPFFARQLSKEISRPVIITDNFHRILAVYDQKNALKLDDDIFIVVEVEEEKDVKTILAKNMTLSRMRWQVGEIFFEGLKLSLVAQKRVWGYCYIAYDGELTSQEAKYIWEASLVLLLALRDLTDLKEEQEHCQAEFIRDILYNNYDSQAAIVTKARAWGWALDGAWALAVIEVDSKKEKLAKELVPWKLMDKRRPIATIINGQLIVLIPIPGSIKSANKETVDHLLERFATILHQHGFSKVEAGVGSFADSAEYLYKVYQEAKIALELGYIFGLSYPCHFSEMGVLKFVFSQPAYELQEFCESVLGDLHTHDMENNTGLVETLVAYFDARLQIPECAKLLFIHENTLRNRLKKIEQITSFDLRRVDHLVNLYIACHIKNIAK